MSSFTLKNWTRTWEGGTSIIESCDNPTCVSASTSTQTTEYTANSAELSAIGQKVFKRSRKQFGGGRRIKRLNRRRIRLAGEDQALLAAVPAQTFTCPELF